MLLLSYGNQISSINNAGRMTKIIERGSDLFIQGSFGSLESEKNKRAFYTKNTLLRLLISSSSKFLINWKLFLFLSKSYFEKNKNATFPPVGHMTGSSPRCPLHSHCLVCSKYNSYFLRINPLIR